MNRKHQAQLYFPAMARDDSTAIAPLILEPRGQRVILSSDLAAIYGVEPRTLNQAVRRNKERFPHDFMFSMTPAEAEAVRRSRSQSVILKRGQNIKHLPMAFTEHGAVMAASVLNSPRAVQMSIFVVRAFMRMRAWVTDQAELSRRLARLEQKVGAHDQELAAILAAIRELVRVPPGAQRRIGFGPHEKS